MGKLNQRPRRPIENIYEGWSYRPILLKYRAKTFIRTSSSLLLSIWVRIKFLRNRFQNWYRIRASTRRTLRTICVRFEENSKFLNRAGIMNEIWVYFYDTETKQMTMKWIFWFFRTKESSSPNIGWKSSCLSFSEWSRYHLHWMFWEEKIVTEKYWLTKLRENSLEKKRNNSQGPLVLLNNVLGTKVTLQLTEIDIWMKVELIDHSSDWAPSASR